MTGPGAAAVTATFASVPADPDYEIEEIGFFAFGGDPRQPAAWKETRAREYVVRAKGGSRMYLPTPAKTLSAAQARLHTLRRSIDAGLGGGSHVSSTLEAVVSRYKARVATRAEAGLVATMLAAPTARPAHRRRRR